MRFKDIFFDKMEMQIKIKANQMEAGKVHISLPTSFDSYTFLSMQICKHNVT